MSLDLDARQRAMLQEMGVTVWAPPAGSAEPAPEATVPTVPAVARPAAPVAAPTAIKKEALRAQPAPVAGPQAPGNAVEFAAGERPPGVDGMGWSALQDAVAGCTACGLCRQRKNTVFGVGSQQARWMVVGEAPGENEDLAGEPFVGQAGKLLDNMLRAVGLDRHATGDSAQAVYITNVVKCRPPANRNPEPQEVAQCAPFLRRQVALLQPEIIFAVGRFAAQTLLEDSVPDVTSLPLGKLRGRVYRHAGIPVVVSYHPAYLLRNLPEKAKAWADLCLALQTAQTPAP